jgi:hypothetical protein
LRLEAASRRMHSSREARCAAVAFGKLRAWTINTLCPWVLMSLHSS